MSATRLDRLAEYLDETRSVHRGRLAQSVAERHLVEAGLRVVARNWKCKVGEIDLVALEGDTLCLIEVKARATAEYGPAIEAVDRRKQRRIAGAANWLLAQTGWDGPVRFDVVGLDREDQAWKITLLRNAFEA